MPRAAKWIQWVVTIGVVLFCVTSFALNIYQDFRDADAEREQMDAEGVETTAEVFRVERSYGQRGRQIVEITYDYEVGGVTYRKIARAYSQAARSLEEGHSVQIRYLASEPGTSAIVGNQAEVNWLPLGSFTYCVYGCGGMVLLAAIAVKVIQWRGRGRIRRLGS